MGGLIFMSVTVIVIINLAKPKGFRRLPRVNRTTLRKVLQGNELAGENEGQKLGKIDES